MRDNVNCKLELDFAGYYTSVPRMNEGVGSSNCPSRGYTKHEGRKKNGKIKKTKRKQVKCPCGKKERKKERKKKGGDRLLCLACTEQTHGTSTDKRQRRSRIVTRNGRSRRTKLLDVSIDLCSARLQVGVGEHDRHARSSASLCHLFVESMYQ
jgi:hypothetical protein